MQGAAWHSGGQWTRRRSSVAPNSFFGRRPAARAEANDRLRRSRTDRRGRTRPLRAVATARPARSVRPAARTGQEIVDAVVGLAWYRPRRDVLADRARGI